MRTVSELALEAIGAGGIVPVLIIDDSALAPEVAAALSDGGIRCAEVTLRTSAGIAAIRRMADVSGFLVGAGTVTSEADVDACVDAGASFIVSPGLDEAVVDRARELGVAVLPGVATATEIQHAARCGLEKVKFFPSELLGGIPMISALAAPFPRMRFMPSGGINQQNVATYLDQPSVFAVGGSWMATRELVNNRDFEVITALSIAASQRASRLGSEAKDWRADHSSPHELLTGST